MGNDIPPEVRKPNIRDWAIPLVALFAAVFALTALIAWLLVGRTERPVLPAALDAQAPAASRVEGLVLPGPSVELIPREQALVEEPMTPPATVREITDSGLPEAELALEIAYAPVPTQGCAQTAIAVIPTVYRANLGTRAEALTAYGGTPSGDLLMINMVGGRSERRVVGGIEYERSPIQPWTQVAADGITMQRLWLHALIEELRSTPLTLTGESAIDGVSRCEYSYTEPTESNLRRFSFFLDGDNRLTDFWEFDNGSAKSVGRIAEIAPYSVQRPL